MNAVKSRENPLRKSGGWMPWKNSKKRTNGSKALQVLNIAVPILEAVAAIAALTVIILVLH